MRDPTGVVEGVIGWVVELENKRETKNLVFRGVRGGEL